MKIKDILSSCDHTLLRQDLNEKSIIKLCDDAIKYGCASVCIPPSFVRFTKEYSNSKIPVCTVIGFPNGYNTSKVKVFEAENAVLNGANEIDMVINIGWLKDKKYDLLLKEIGQIKNACGDKILKVIIETCLLTDEEKIMMCEIINMTDADFIKTSTGFSTSGASFEDIMLFKKYLKKDKKIKAAGGISSLEDAKDFIELGASRLGTSKIVNIIKKKELNTDYEI